MLAMPLQFGDSVWGEWRGPRDVAITPSFMTWKNTHTLTLFAVANAAAAKPRIIALCHPARSFSKLMGVFRKRQLAIGFDPSQVAGYNVVLLIGEWDQDTQTALSNIIHLTIKVFPKAVTPQELEAGIDSL
jgi:hypothetical protein